ncbi:CXXC-type zinc finger protein 1 isoform X1 [Helicoverpa armigera]|uniref:CXXC-type zinc finger protein 1-like isoform X1 n=1 Tax=Helicoverpa zea TaxID=7113 RepID=UPI001F57BB07|nr:CXXC-type zinc finger protein 1-like isoform X1 [Helicoverpa zea]XP_047034108.1 CXXC-type zinc finger protein 1-like isoform X2 [Helicoverpa zea]XP_049704402.1 CXXC-type zinc finger protein 1 isoform X1 [Helicoverpa armigera]
MGDKKYKQSKAEIAKQFNLPERQSKITTLLNQAGQAYCICRSSDSSRFMIACDACEEWYHGDCINISEREAKYIKNYFCDRCREEDPTLKTRFRPQKRENDSDIAPRDDRKKKRKEKDHSENKSSKRPSTKDGCGDCPGCLQMNDCGHCEACEDMYKYGSSNKLKLKCKMRLCIKNKKTSRQSSSSNRIKKKHHEREQHEPEESLAHLQTSEARQCYGPQCTRAAQFGSKYCSAQCGMRLATARIYQVLPQRIQEWSLSSCVAEQKNRKALEVVRGGLARAQAALRALDTQHSELDAIVARAKNATIVHTDDKDADDETSMYCITCGHEIHSRTAVKHMEKCFVKYEAQASFGSRHRTRIDGQSMFCDYYNPINATYCKRLRVMCPEHFKDPKVGDNDVCGCPLVRNVFKPTGEFCRAPKKSCLKHYQWEKLRRAEIDMERVRQWLKLDELVEQERSIRLAMASRAGVLGLMLHSTYNHEVMERITTKATENGKVKESS